MIYLCDFEDSFTYNIYADFTEMGYKVEVIPLKNVFKFLQDKKLSTAKEVIILGPGPGHPKDYSFLYSSIKNLIGRESLMLFGVCLGHQLIWSALGEQCTHSATPIHGQARQLVLDSLWLEKLELTNPSQKVQFYNSLCIKINNSQLKQYVQKDKWLFFVNNNELYMSYNEGVLTYQFHPESVGTSCQKAFYSPVSSFLL